MTIAITVEGPVTVYVTGAPAHPLHPSFGPDLPKEEPMQVEKTTSTEFLSTLVIAPTTLGGQPAEVDAPPVWVVESGTGTLSETTPPDPLRRLVGAPDDGDVLVSATADADLGEGVKTLRATFLVHFQDPQAEHLNPTFGEDVLKPPA